MKKLVAVVLALVMVASVSAAAFASTGDNGNLAPNGKHFNLNIIGVPNQKNLNFDGGEGARIFVLRDKPTQFYVYGNGTTQYEILDHDGTDGKVGTGLGDPGITFPYDMDTGRWQVDIWVRLVGPNSSDNTLDWSSAVYENGAWQVPWASFTLDKSTKFTLKTTDLLKDGYQNILWTLDPGTKFRICQLRIYLVER